MKMNFAVLSAIVLMSSAQAFDFNCITQEEAVTSATTNLEKLRLELREQSSFWISRQKIREYVGRIDFIETERQYKTAYLAKWTCAPGADCYVGIAVDCLGNASVYQFAD